MYVDSTKSLLLGLCYALQMFSFLICLNNDYKLFLANRTAGSSWRCSPGHFVFLFLFLISLIYCFPTEIVKSLRRCVLDNYWRLVSGYLPGQCGRAEKVHLGLADVKMSLSKQNNFNSLTFSAQLPQFTPRSVRSLLLSLTGVNKAILGEGTQGQYIIQTPYFDPSRHRLEKQSNQAEIKSILPRAGGTNSEWDETRDNPLRARQALLCAIGQSKQIPPIKLGVMIHTHLCLQYCKTKFSLG